MNSKYSTEDISILYIASSSRSGSTVLEHRLAQIDGVISCGEIKRLPDFFNNNWTAIKDEKNRHGCTCGKPLANCSFWRDVQKRSRLDFSQLIINKNQTLINRTLLKFCFYMLGPVITQKIAKHYKPFLSELRTIDELSRIYEAISAVSNCKIIVDASKTNYQYMKLKTRHQNNTYLLALFRDGRAVSKSMIKGNRKLFFKNGKYSSPRTSNQRLRSAATTWALNSIELLFLYYRTPKKFRNIIKYEKFCKHPDSIIESSLYKISTAHPKKREPHIQSHAIGGSPSRFEKDFNKIENKDEWSSHWTKKDKKVFPIYGLIINRLLGYK